MRKNATMVIVPKDEYDRMVLNNAMKSDIDVTFTLKIDNVKPIVRKRIVAMNSLAREHFADETRSLIQAAVHQALVSKDIELMLAKEELNSIKATRRYKWLF